MVEPDSTLPIIAFPWAVERYRQPLLVGHLEYLRQARDLQATRSPSRALSLVQFPHLHKRHAFSRGHELEARMRTEVLGVFYLAHLAS